MEIRRYYEFLKTKGRVENFDPDVIMGSTTGAHPFLVSGHMDTSVQYIADVLQENFKKINQIDSEELWQVFFNTEYCPIIPGLPFNTNSNLVSNIGFFDFGEGPIQQVQGASTFTANFDDLPFKPGAFNIMGTKNGILAHEGTYEGVNKEKQRDIMRIMIEVSKICAKKGAENVKVADICEMLKVCFDKFGKGIMK